jgi:GAF domain-containing protein
LVAPLLAAGHCVVLFDQAHNCEHDVTTEQQWLIKINPNWAAAVISQLTRQKHTHQVGFGRSDKPSLESDYTYERHLGWNTDLLITLLDLKGLTVCSVYSNML